jgi:hypothetical protein
VQGCADPVLWIRIRSGSVHFPDRNRHSGPVNPDPVSISTKYKDKIHFFPENFNLEKCPKYCKLWHLWLWRERLNHVNWNCCEWKFEKIRFFNICKIWGMIWIRIRIWIGIKMKVWSWSASKRCRSTTMVPAMYIYLILHLVKIVLKEKFSFEFVHQEVLC